MISIFLCDSVEIHILKAFLLDLLHGRISNIAQISSQNEAFNYLKLHSMQCHEHDPVKHLFVHENQVHALLEIRLRFLDDLYQLSVFEFLLFFQAGVEVIFVEPCHGSCFLIQTIAFWTAFYFYAHLLSITLFAPPFFK
jgi:hypothetical protein